MKKEIATVSAPAAIGPYSQAIMTDGLVFVSGQIPVDPATGTMPEGIKAQTAQAIRNIENILKEAGLSLADVVKTTVFLGNMDDFAAMNEVYAEHFTEAYPARAAFEVVRLPKDAMVEIECIAVRG